MRDKRKGIAEHEGEPQKGGMIRTCHLDASKLLNFPLLRNTTHYHRPY